MKKNQQIQGEMRVLVMARLKAASDDLRISIGSADYSKEELLKNVEAGSKLGQEIIKTQIEYLRDMAGGAVYQSE